MILEFLTNPPAWLKVIYFLAVVAIVYFDLVAVMVLA